jgi:hypothetical protein
VSRKHLRNGTETVDEIVAGHVGGGARCFGLHATVRTLPEAYIFPKAVKFSTEWFRVIILSVSEELRLSIGEGGAIWDIFGSNQIFPNDLIHFSARFYD